MSQEIDDLIKKCVELREAGRLDEAIIASRRATNVEPERADTWWQLALAVADKDGPVAAIEYFKKTVNLADGFAYGWLRLGNAYNKAVMMDEAVNAWENACARDPDDALCRYNLVDVYILRNKKDEKDKLFSQLIELERLGQLRLNDYHSLAMEYHNKGEYLNAIPYYKRYLSEKDDAYGYTNLGLSYSSQQIGQDLDAADCYRFALSIKPDFDKTKNLLQNISTKLLSLKSKISSDSIVSALVPTEYWYENYINPYELLQINAYEDSSEIDIKELQKSKKKLLQEVELEDGLIAWMPNLTIDRSRAIKLADELMDETLRSFHQKIFKCKSLLEFLSRSSLNLFLYDEFDFPSELLIDLETDELFAKWLSEIYCKQYDLVFASALLTKDVHLIEVLLDGRRFVTPEHEDKCFTTAARYGNEMLVKLKEAQISAQTTKPTIEYIKSVLAEGNLGFILEVLPPAFQDLQSEAAMIIRNISIDTYNKHQDADLAKDILHLTQNFARKWPSFRVRLEEDLATLNELIQKERQDESYLVFGQTKFQITREGVTHGERFIKAVDVETLRWGITVNSSSGQKFHEYKIVIGGKGAYLITAHWKSGADIEKQDDLFQKCIDAIFSYLLPNVTDKIIDEIGRGRTVLIGAIPVSLGGLTLKAKGWLGLKEEHCAWRTLSSEISNGTAIITSTTNSKARASLVLSEIDNAWILHILIKQGTLK